MKTKLLSIVDQIFKVGTAAILIALNLFLSSCDRKINEKTYLNENIELKIELYTFLNNSFLQGDTIFDFKRLKKLESNNYDSILIFPSYTPIETIESYLNGGEIKDLPNEQFLNENEDLIVVLKQGDPLFYLKLDSLYQFADIENRLAHSYMNSEFRIQPYDQDSVELGAYLILLDQTE